jgi:hypothetical protein
MSVSIVRFSNHPIKLGRTVLPPNRHRQSHYRPVRLLWLPRAVDILATGRRNYGKRQSQLRTRFTARVRAITAEQFIFAITPKPFLIVIAFVAHHDEHGPGRTAIADRLQKMRRTQDIRLIGHRLASADAVISEPGFANYIWVINVATVKNYSGL